MRTALAPIAVLALSGVTHAQVFVGEEYERRAQYDWTSDVIPGDGMDLVESFDPGGFGAELVDSASGDPGYSLEVYAVQESTIDDAVFWAAGKSGYAFSVGQGQGAHLDLSASSSAFFFFELDVDAPPGPFRLNGYMEGSEGWNLDLLIVNDDTGETVFESHEPGAFDETIQLEQGVFYTIEAASWGAVLIDDPDLADAFFNEGSSFEVHLEQVACPADVNGDGELNVLDFVAFQLLWQAQAPEGDCDANGLYNVLDFVCFQQRFVEGCP